MLAKRGYTVDLAENGIEAIELFTKGNYDAILMDIQMPKMNGIEATEKIRSFDLEGRHTPIIALTAYSLPGDREKFMKLGLDEYVSKPIHMDDLFQVLDKVTSKSFSELPNSVYLTEDGEVRFTFDKANHTMRTNQDSFMELLKNIDLLIYESECDNLLRIEAIAKTIKDIASNLDVVDIKETAFKIELAARRSNLVDVKKYIERISYEYKLYHDLSND